MKTIYLYIIALSNFDVILYMLIQKEEFQNQNEDNNQNNEINREEINNNLEELNSNANINNNNQRRNRGGFDVFLFHGLTAEEIRTLRLIFHFSQAQESLMTGVPLDWSIEGIYQREERWLINQINEMFNRNTHRNNNYISLNVNDNPLFIGRNNFEIFYEQQIDLRIVFILGFLVGLITNVLGIILLFCRFRATFKLGLICGMIISMVFFSKMLYFK